MIIDTHIHIWDLERSAYSWIEGADTALKKSFSIGELEPSRQQAGITAGVFVQADVQIEDSFHMLDVAKHTDWIRGVVTWLPLAEREKTEMLLCSRLLLDPYFVGVRHLIHDEADPQWLLQADVIESLKILAANNIPYDVVGVLPQHIETVLKVAERVPGLKMVFDHLGTPPVKEGKTLGRWGELMKEAAANPAFYAKISGLGTIAGGDRFSADAIRPYVEFALAQFGTDRCFCGGDWPVSLLAKDYISTWKIYKEVLSTFLHAAELEKVYSGNAIRFYKLQMQDPF